MGPERSLPKLFEAYQSRTEPVPTKQFSTLKEWSTKYNWQQRIIDRIEEDANEVRKRLQERAVKFRERVTGAIEVDVTRLLQRLRDTAREILTKSVKDLERLIKLYYQPAEQPLSDRSEPSADVSVETFIREVLDGADGRR